MSLRNWTELSAGLIGPENVTMWIDDRVQASPYASGVRKRVRRRICAGAATRCCVAQAGFSRAASSASGLRAEPTRVSFSGLRVRSVTTLSRRAKTRQVILPAPGTGEPLHLIVETRGLMLHGEGEWKVR